MKSLLLALVFSSFASASDLKVRHLEVAKGLELRVGVLPAKGEARGDILYLPGFADRLDNHGPLFTAWSEKGFRVVSFDYPGHGESRGRKNSINRFGFAALADFASQVEAATREDSHRPLLLAGWSTGGLLAVRILQAGPTLGRDPKGVLLFAPGVSVYTLVGKNGFVTEPTLTSNPNPPHTGPIRPVSPLLVPVFAASLLSHSHMAWQSAVPEIPMLVLVGGDREDRYAKTREVKRWALRQREWRDSSVTAFQCRGAFHELDNEPGATGATVRQIAASFAESVVTGSYDSSPTAPCSRF
jgi:alpha-beta hydrolase superfamily lysophospholipase